MSFNALKFQIRMINQEKDKNAAERAKLSNTELSQIFMQDVFSKVVDLMEDSIELQPLEGETIEDTFYVRYTDRHWSVDIEFFAGGLCTIFGDGYITPHLYSLTNCFCQIDDMEIMYYTADDYEEVELPGVQAALEDKVTEDLNIERYR
jgi:hypothetical protein